MKLTWRSIYAVLNFWVFYCSVECDSSVRKRINGGTWCCETDYFDLLVNCLPIGSCWELKMDPRADWHNLCHVNRSFHNNRGSERLVYPFSQPSLETLDRCPFHLHGSFWNSLTLILESRRCTHVARKERSRRNGNSAYALSPMAMVFYMGCPKHEMNSLFRGRKEKFISVQFTRVRML